MRFPAVMLCLILVACGGGGGNTGGGTTPTPTNPNTFTISASGVVSPKELTVSPGTRVLFVNNDSRRHDMTSDPHPEHSDCPEINSVGVLNNGQSRETANLNAIRTCGFHDHDLPDNTNLKGRIIVR
jgi:plastocyanin